MRGQFLAGAGAGELDGAASDSRAVKAGNLFFALSGERTDGFEHAGAAAKAGASAVVVPGGRGIPAGCEGLPVIAVSDVRVALGDLARVARAEFAGKVVGVTGSNGKTTTKELIAAALATAGPVLRTEGNFNTDVGMPLTILGGSGKEAFWVLEMAMRARGEIDYLTQIARPHVAVVTNVAAAHLGRLGSLEEVAKAKGEIFGGLGPDGVAVLPNDEPRLEPEAARVPEERKRRFGFPDKGTHVDRDVRILEVVAAGSAGSVVRLAVGDQPVVVRLPLAGEHNARNAAATLAVVAALEVPVLAAAAGLEKAALPPHRSRIVAAGGRTILDDCYNANPASMTAALATVIASVGGSASAFAILGDMLELGPESEALHRALGREAAFVGLAGLAAVGEFAAEVAAGAKEAGLTRTMITRDPEAAAAQVAEWSASGDWILVKASRGVRLDRAVEALQAKLK